jgi:hypothetical protein
LDVSALSRRDLGAGLLEPSRRALVLGAWSLALIGHAGNSGR